uniref:XRN_N domain-containing protein n=1 Tax=Steinernema glaseri TaxID=37863 RepID=A0A1I8AVY4_9BILA
MQIYHLLNSRSLSSCAIVCCERSAIVVPPNREPRPAEVRRRDNPMSVQPTIAVDLIQGRFMSTITPYTPIIVHPTVTINLIFFQEIFMPTVQKELEGLVTVVLDYDGCLLDTPKYR